jgi:hypothetical protein
MSELEKNTLAEPCADRLPRAHGPRIAETWKALLIAGARAQQIVPGSVAVGGTAAALYAGHRVSHDVDNLVMTLENSFDDVMGSLEQSANWRTARIKRPVLILGSLDGFEVGFRQARRLLPIQSVSTSTGEGDLCVPTLRELIGMKAFLAYSRNVLRDFLDFAALTTCTDDRGVIDALRSLDDVYGHLQTNSVGLEVAKALSKPEPVDLMTTDLSRYRALDFQWHDWARTTEICQRFGKLLGQTLVNPNPQ